MIEILLLDLICFTIVNVHPVRLLTEDACTRQKLATICYMWEKRIVILNVSSLAGSQGGLQHMNYNNIKVSYK